MICNETNPTLEFEKIKKYIIENDVKELFNSVKIVQDSIDTNYEFVVLDTIDLCIESLNKMGSVNTRVETLKSLKEVRKRIVGNKYDYLKKLKINKENDYWWIF